MNYGVCILWACSIKENSHFFVSFVLCLVVEQGKKTDIFHLPNTNTVIQNTMAFTSGQEVRFILVSLGNNGGGKSQPTNQLDLVDTLRARLGNLFLTENWRWQLWLPVVTNSKCRLATCFPTGWCQEELQSNSAGTLPRFKFLLDIQPVIPAGKIHNYTANSGSASQKVRVPQGLISIWAYVSEEEALKKI